MQENDSQPQESKVLTMSLGDVAAKLFADDLRSLSLSRVETEALIDDLVEQFQEPISDYRQEHQISPEEMALITFR